MVLVCRSFKQEKEGQQNVFFTAQGVFELGGSQLGNSIRFSRP
jgi:hypothetical protein